MTSYIEMYKELILRQVKRKEISDTCGGKWVKSYIWPNEDEREILKLIDLKRIKNVLTVLSSGDYLYSLIGKNIKNIDTFDVSPIAEYYALGLKRAMIEMISNYGDFKRYLGTLIYSDNLRYVSSEIEKLIPYMLEKYKIFWSEIIRYNYNLQKKNGKTLSLLCMLLNSDKCLPSRCSYLTSQNEYDKVKENLSKSKVSYYNINILELSKPLEKDKLYDLIIMSNIMDYYHERKRNYPDIYTTYNDLRSVEKRLFRLMNPSGVIVNTITGNNSSLFFQSKVNISQLQANEKVYNISNSKSYDHDRCLILTK